MSSQSAKKAPVKKASKKSEKSVKKEPVKKAPAKKALAKKAPAKKKASRPAVSTVEDVADVPVVTKASDKKTPATPCIAFVAAGPGDPDLIAHRGARMLGDAGYVLADEAAVPIAEAFVAADLIEVVNPDAAGPAADRIKPAIDAAKAGTVVVRLLAGDPMMGSGLVGEVGAVRRAKIDIEIVPAVSEITGVPAYAGFGLVGNKAKEVRVIDAQDSSVRWEEIAVPRVTAVFPSGANHLVHIARAMLEAGRSGDTPVAITRDGTTVDQQDSL